MSLLEPQFFNGRDRIDSCVKLTAHWVEGWKFKDVKWKFEEETRLPHVESAFFRCRVHLFSHRGENFSKDLILEKVKAVDCKLVLDGFLLEFCQQTLTIHFPLNLPWGITDNQSRNPCIFCHAGEFGLALDPIGSFNIQILITYRNLQDLSRSKKMFVDRPGGYTWIGSARPIP